MSNSYTYTFNYQDNITGAFTKTTSAITGGVDKINKKTNSAYEGFKKWQTCMIGFNQASEIFNKMGQSLEKITEPGAAFEQSMADLSAITGIVGKDLELLGKTAKATGRSSGLGAVQATEAYKILASQIDVSKIGLTGLQELQKKTITLSQASGLAMGDAAQALSGTINQFGMQASEAQRVINVLAAGSKYGAAEIPELAQSFKVVGAAAKSAGLTVEDTAGAIEVLSKNNMKGAEAGTALRNILLKMQTGLGVDFNSTSMSEALEALKPKLNDVNFLTKTFGIQNTVAAQFLIQNADMVAEMTTRVTDTNVPTEQAAIRTGTWQHKMKLFGAAVNNAKIWVFEHTKSLMSYLPVIAQVGQATMALGPAFCAAKEAVNWLRIAENRQMIVSKLSAAWKYIAGGAAIAYGSIVGVLTGKITLVTVATALWNAVLAINPIVWVVAGIAALVAGVVLAWKKFEGFGVFVVCCC